jgi:hypothetical protein
MPVGKRMPFGMMAYVRIILKELFKKWDSEAWT